MRKEASLPAPDTLQIAGTPAPTPLPSQRQVSHPHGIVPSLQSILMNQVIQGILEQSYTSLDLGYEVLTELINRLQAKRLLSDENVALFAALPELYLNNCAISDKGVRQLLEKSEYNSVREFAAAWSREKARRNPDLGNGWNFFFLPPFRSRTINSAVFCLPFAPIPPIITLPSVMNLY